MPIDDTVIPKEINLADEIDDDTIKYDTKGGTFTSNKLYTEYIPPTNIPVGGIIAWLKDLSGVPNLDNHFMECNGATVNDTESPLNGQVLPNLNSGTYRILRGANNSGGTGGADTHTHTTGSGGGNGHFNGTGGSPIGSFSSHHHTITTESNIPAYYEVVYIIRIK